jgi:glutaredoxin 3
MKIVIYTKAGCSYCAHAKQLLEQKGLAYTEIRVDLNPAMCEEMVQLTGRKTMPQIIIQGEPIGGFDDLYALETSGQLDKILKKEGL